MCKSTVVNYLEELKNLKKIHPEHLEYINDCEKCKVKPSKICERLKSRIKALQLVGDDTELQEIYEEFEDQINNPEVITNTLKSYILAVKISEEHPELGINKKILRASIGNITKVLAMMNNQLRKKGGLAS